MNDDACVISPDGKLYTYMKPSIIVIIYVGFVYVHKSKCLEIEN